MCCGSTRAPASTWAGRSASAGRAAERPNLAAQPWAPSCSVEALRARARLLAAIRGFFAERGVLEVQTPALGRAGVTDPAIGNLTAAGGRFLQTSPEYHMKRLLAAGAPSIYQIAPAFRAGERGRWHNPEFTILEWYRLGYDAERLMDEVAALVDVLLGPGECQTHTWAALIAAGVGADDVSPGALARAARRLGLPGVDPAAAADLVLAHAIESLGAGRVFITGYPADQAALARLGPDGRAARFELVVRGVEVANGYHELVDPEELERRLSAAARERERRGLPSVPLDDALLAAHRQGLPDCAGVAMGLDRLLALRLGARSLAEVLAFDWERA